MQTDDEKDGKNENIGEAQDKVDKAQEDLDKAQDNLEITKQVEEKRAEADELEKKKK